MKILFIQLLQGIMIKNSLCYNGRGGSKGIIYHSNQYMLLNDYLFDEIRFAVKAVKKKNGWQLPTLPVSFPHQYHRPSWA